jgi:hypothetical protein
LKGADADHRDQSVSDLLAFDALCVRVGPGAHLSGLLFSIAFARSTASSAGASVSICGARLACGAFCFLLIFLTRFFMVPYQ